MAKKFDKKMDLLPRKNKTSYRVGLGKPPIVTNKSINL